MKIVEVSSGKALSEARALFLEYASSLRFDLSFQGFQEEIERFPGDYSPPEGRVLVAYDGVDVAGCVGLRNQGGKICEMKRLYVRPAFRGKGIGRGLASTVIEEARKAGYDRIRLDTVPSMKEAIGLYRSLGFRTVEPYRYNPIPGAVFMELEL